jgi:hypothetical protein
MSANDRQVSGNHYNKEGEQHWDRMWRLYGRGYFVGCSTKYVERYHLKNGKEDLEKAIHFIQKLIELEYPEDKVESVPDHLKEFVPTERQQEVAAKFEHLRKKNEEAISPMLQRLLAADDEEPKTQGYVNQDR